MPRPRLNPDGPLSNADKQRRKYERQKAERSVMREVLDDIAAQRLTSEMDTDQAENADYEGAYNHIVSMVRNALASLSETQTEHDQ